MSRIKLPSPLETISGEDGYVSRPWYQYFISQQKLDRPEVAIVTTESTSSVVYCDEITVLASTAGVVHELEDPRIGSRTVIICNIPSTQGGTVTVAASTDVAIGPSGENAVVFDTAASTYEYVELLGTSVSQYHILTQSTNVSVGASS